MIDTLVARRIRDNLAWTQGPEEVNSWAEVRRFWPAADDDFVGGVYRAILGRAAEGRELRHGLHFLAEGGLRAELVRLLATSEEARRGRCDTSWLPRLASLSEEKLWAELVRLWPQPPEPFVQGLHELLLLRPASQHEFAVCLSYLASGNSRIELVQLLTGSDEFARLGIPTSWIGKLPWLTEEGLSAELLGVWGQADAPFVRRVFELFLRRPPGERDAADNVSLLRNGCARLDLMRSLADGPAARELGGPAFAALEARLSEEMWSRLVRLWEEADLPFLNGLYQLILWRPADPGTLVSQVTALRSGTSRLALVRALAASEEGRRMVAGTTWLSWLNAPRGRAALAAAARRRLDEDAARVQAVLSRLAVSAEPEPFVRRAYQEIMGRQPTPEELKKQSQRLRYIPFFTRGVLVRRLLQFREKLQGG